MQSALRRWGKAFRKKVFLPEEQSYCDDKAEPARHYAGRFAIKEAVSKAFGTGISEHLGWLDIEVRRDPASGAPSVRLREKGGRLARRRGVARVLVSLSHTRHYAVAQALLVGRAGKENRR
ncbi:MAG: holo-ACP synthase [Kiritimatiellae bacterium]|nr:holo-ACP synthase [Kiritimatiellia bacterium]